MIDFYKYNFLSVFGKEAGSMNEIQYQTEVIGKYDEYLEKLKEAKQKAEENI